MMLDIKKVFSTYQEPISGQESLDLSEMDFPGYSVAGPADVRWQIRLEGSVLSLMLEISAFAEFECARCLKECRQNFEVQVEHDIRESECEASPEAELPFDERGRLDLKELCYQELVSEIPSVLLCSEDCKGLCPICGRRNPCACTQETNGDVVDERLAILKTLL